MFGQPTVADSTLQAWLDLLRQAELAARRGALIERNLRDDVNVCPALQHELRDFVAAQPPAAMPDDAAQQYDRFLQDLHQNRPPCQHSDNVVNQLPTAPLPRLVRSVDSDAFLKYSYLAANNRKVPRYHRASPLVKAKIRLRELQKRGIQPAALRGSIGRSVVFATSDDVVARYQAGTLNADGVRDRLGLDDASPYGRDQFMVILCVRCRSGRRWYVLPADRAGRGLERFGDCLPALAPGARATRTDSGFGHGTAGGAGSPARRFSGRPSPGDCDRRSSDQGPVE